MSVDCCITLPPACRVRDVATVLARLTGATISLDEKPVLAAHVDGVRLEALPEIPECVRISWWDGEQKSRSVLYHFEWGVHPGCRGLILRSTAQALAMGKALIDFFGGEADFIDSDEVDCDYSQPARADIHASDGDAWDQFQRRLAAVQPITEDDIAAMAPFAAYH